MAPKKRGLYANIHAKRKRGEAPRKPGSPGAPTDKAFRDSAKTAKKRKKKLRLLSLSLQERKKSYLYSTMLAYLITMFKCGNSR